MFPTPVNKIVGGWYLSGIFTALSGQPILVNESYSAFGAGQRSTFDSAAVPLTTNFNTGAHSGVYGSNGVGTTANPAAGGSGLNLFANPAAALSEFGYVDISNGQEGYAHPLRGLPFWNLDGSVGKKIQVTERVNGILSFDFYNLFNNVNLANPSSLPLYGSSISNFGVLSATVVPGNRQASSRWIMIGARVEF